MLKEQFLWCSNSFTKGIINQSLLKATIINSKDSMNPSYKYKLIVSE